MKRNSNASGRKVPVALLFACAIFLLAPACRKVDEHFNMLKHFSQVNLVDNNHQYNAPNTDPKQINAWGLAFSPTGIPWVNSQGGHVSAIYNAEGATLRPPVNVPSPGSGTGGNPTGIVFNGTTDFELTKGGPARFIFVGVDGILSAWNGQYGNFAVRIRNNSATSAYTGLAIGKVGDASYLYAADFRAGKIEVWDKNFAVVRNMSFSDQMLPGGYSPYNIQAVGDWLYVTYAKVASNGHEETGIGKGYVSIFKMSGEFVKRFASAGALDAPWGIAKAHASFFAGTDDQWEGQSGKTSSGDKILIGNFGNGYINVYTEEGRYLGPLKTRGNPVQIEGLWAISFAPATATSVDPNRLYFAAGPEHETAGLFGYIIKQ